MLSHFDCVKDDLVKLADCTAPHQVLIVYGENCGKTTLLNHYKEWLKGKALHITPQVLGGYEQCVANPTGCNMLVMDNIDWKTAYTLPSVLDQFFGMYRPGTMYRHRGLNIQPMFKKNVIDFSDAKILVLLDNPLDLSEGDKFGAYPWLHKVKQVPLGTINKEDRVRGYHADPDVFDSWMRTSV